ncbi:MAG: ZIP family metal transporter [Verrucomicrobiales bacterium]
MNEMIQAGLLALFAGATIPLGGWLARLEHLRPEWLEEEFRHSVIAFGGGALLAAVALVLVPHGIDHYSSWAAGLLFLAGGIVMMWVDRKLNQSGTPAANLIAMLSDYLPEALALGAVLSGDQKGAVLLAGLIAIQNLPEGFNAYREMIRSPKLSSSRILWVFVAAALLGPVAATVGLGFLAQEPKFLGGITLFSSGAILYLVFQDVAPQAKLERHWAPPLGAVLGFVLGMVGEMLTS